MYRKLKYYPILTKLKCSELNIPISDVDFQLFKELLSFGFRLSVGVVFYSVQIKLSYKKSAVAKLLADEVWSWQLEKGEKGLEKELFFELNALDREEISGWIEQYVDPEKTLAEILGDLYTDSTLSSEEWEQMRRKNNTNE